MEELAPMQPTKMLNLICRHSSLTAAPPPSSTSVETSRARSLGAFNNRSVMGRIIDLFNMGCEHCVVLLPRKDELPKLSWVE
ncbi:hypothetical protein CEXT_224281 [Caerostris extrusa]|uniref:Uncharacterized protein n=1 Tax=Caerostris extrusa TaxID=172846 RepID=A0AAV4XG31_CAEEX|nr:hypothetical protein CEXT_224281 [Caerostris extrusa]